MCFSFTDHVVHADLLQSWLRRLEHADSRRFSVTVCRTKRKNESRELSRLLSTLLNYIATFISFVLRITILSIIIELLPACRSPFLALYPSGPFNFLSVINNNNKASVRRCGTSQLIRVTVPCKHKACLRPLMN